MKKLLAILMTALMLLGLMAGCASQQEAVEAPVEEVVEEPAEEAVVVDTIILKEQDDKMINTYSVIAVNPEAPFADADGNPVEDVAVNTAGADALIQFLLSEEGLKLAGEYGVEQYGDYLFYVKEDAPRYEGEIAAATEETKVIRLSTTTSVNDSGLL
ncbi:MAG: hypothetical protein IJ941_00635, partial [Clostridia bacterium]|nr:hypothetical protein [Clostridia bacterium]